MSKNDKMTVETDGINITIKMPIDLLVWSQEHRDEPYKITVKDEMVKSIIGNLLTFQTDNFSPNDTDFQDFLDVFFDECYDMSEPWLLAESDLEDEEPSDEDLDEIEEDNE